MAKVTPEVTTVISAQNLISLQLNCTADTDKCTCRPPILQLANELLEDVLNHLVNLTFVANSSEVTVAKDFLRYTHICSQIREIALASSRLWRYVDVSHQRLSEEFLVRSRSAPILLFTTSPGYGDWSRKFRLNPENLRPHVSRINTVHVDLCQGDMRQLFSVIHSITPRISTLRLRVNTLGYSLDPLPYRLEYDFPSVRQLGLVQVSVRWDSFTNLTQLYLRGEPDTLDITFAQLRNLLLRSPYLEHLSLNITLSVIGSISEPLIHLPRLRFLSLETNTLATSHLLHQFDSVPSSAHVRIYEHADLTEPMSYLPHSISHLSPLQITPTTILRLLRDHTLYLLSANAKPWSCDSGNTCFYVLPKVSQEGGALVDRWFEAILTHFDLSLLTMLELEIDTKINVRVLESFLYSMPLLHTLRVDGPSWASAITALGATWRDSTPPCPVLTRIEVRAENTTWEDMAPLHCGPVIVPIVIGLHERFVSLGHPLPTLVLDEPFGKVTADLKAYVAEIIVAVERNMD